MIFRYCNFLTNSVTGGFFFNLPEYPNNHKRDDTTDLGHRALPWDVPVPVANGIGFGPV